VGVRALVIGAAVVALAASGCGSKEPPPFKEVQQPATTTSGVPDTALPAGTTITGRLTNLGPHYNRAFAQLIDALDTLSSRADTVTAAATDAKVLADRVAGGYNPPSGSAPPVTRLRDALSSFDDVLHTVLTSSAQLPQLAVQLELRSAQVAKRRPREAAALLTAKQRVDTTIAEVSGLDRAITVAQRKVGQQLSNVSLDGGALNAAVAAGSDSAAAALAKVNAAVDAGFQALVQAA
jgi:hypothetical protein